MRESTCLREHAAIVSRIRIHKLLWLPSVASPIDVCSAPLRGANRSTGKYCRLIGWSNREPVQPNAARPFGALDNLTVNAIPCDRNLAISLRMYRRPSVRSISIQGSRSGRAESTRGRARPRVAKLRPTCGPRGRSPHGHTGPRAAH